MQIQTTILATLYLIRAIDKPQSHVYIENDEITLLADGEIIVLHLQTRFDCCPYCITALSTME